MPVLKLASDDDDKELQFTIQSNLQLSIEGRLHKFLELSKQILKLAGKYEDYRSPQVIKREAR